jgi:hypothetical protein
MGTNLLEGFVTEIVSFAVADVDLASVATVSVHDKTDVLRDRAAL